jgi:hypothetical protein
MNMSYEFYNNRLLNQILSNAFINKNYESFNTDRDYAELVFHVDKGENGDKLNLYKNLQNKTITFCKVTNISCYFDLVSKALNDIKEWNESNSDSKIDHHQILSLKIKNGRVDFLSTIEVKVYKNEIKCLLNAYNNKYGFVSKISEANSTLFLKVLKTLNLNGKESSHFIDNEMIERLLEYFLQTNVRPFTITNQKCLLMDDLMILVLTKMDLDRLFRVYSVNGDLNQGFWRLILYNELDKNLCMNDFLLVPDLRIKKIESECLIDLCIMKKESNKKFQEQFYLSVLSLKDKMDSVQMLKKTIEAYDRQILKESKVDAIGITCFIQTSSGNHDDEKNSIDMLVQENFANKIYEFSADLFLYFVILKMDNLQKEIKLTVYKYFKPREDFLLVNEAFFFCDRKLVLN